MRNIKRAQAVLLCVIVLALTCFISIPAVGATPASGTVNVDDSLNVRSGPSTNYKKIGSLLPGTYVIIDEVAYSPINKDEWYKITVPSTSLTGYVLAIYIKPNISYEIDSDFEKHLTNQNFPESYKKKLRELHAQYPNWVFVADHLSMTWQEALAAESTVGKSLVEISKPDSWKSMEYGAYDWGKNQYVPFDGSTWVTAERSVVAYYLDPRNSLDGYATFQFLMQSYDSSLQTLDGLKNMVSGTFLANAFPEAGYSTYSDVLMEAARVSGVNPYVLASMIIVEQGTDGHGGCISGSIPGFEGYYNFFNIGATPTGTYNDAVKNGLLYAQKSGWNTRAGSIINGAAWYSKNYISIGQDTLYYKKFNVVVPPYYYHEYLTNVYGSYTEGIRLRSGYNSVLNSDLTFKIPVYKNMPEELCPPPGTTGDNDCYLSSLDIGGISLAPEFSMYTSRYEAIVDNSVSSISIIAQPHNDASSVSGAGTKQLNVGINTFTLTVTSSSGMKRNYTVDISRSEPSPAPGNTPEIKTTEYNVGTYISGITPGTEVQSFIDRMKIENGYIKVLDSSGTEKSGRMATGDTVRIYSTDNRLVYSYRTVIYGDVNGDGLLNVIDMSRIQKHILEVVTISGCYIEAADPSHDSKVNVIDMSRIQKNILGVALITQ